MALPNYGQPPTRRRRIRPLGPSTYGSGSYRSPLQGVPQPGSHGLPMNASAGVPQAPGRGRPMKPKGPPSATRGPKPPFGLPGWPMPVDPIYDEELDRLRTALQNTQTDLTTQQVTTSQEYGLDDPTNPFSRAALLQKRYEDSQRSSVNSYAAGGHLYSGALSNARYENTRGFLQGRDSLQRSYESAQQDIARRRAEARNAFEQGRIAAYGQRVSRALANRPDEVPAPYKPPPKHVKPILGRPQPQTHGKRMKHKSKHRKRRRNSFYG